MESLLSQPLSHTVPHTPLMQISTLPALSTGPSTKRRVSFVQFWTAVEEEYINFVKLTNYCHSVTHIKGSSPGGSTVQICDFIDQPFNSQGSWPENICVQTKNCNTVNGDTFSRPIHVKKRGEMVHSLSTKGFLQPNTKCAFHHVHNPPTFPYSTSFSWDGTYPHVLK